MPEDEYEYMVQHQLTDSRFNGWTGSGLGKWVDETTAMDRFKRYVAAEKEAEKVDGVKDFNYRIVRRPKDSVEVYMTEGDLDA